MKTPVKVSVKVQRIAGALSRMSIQNVNHLQVYFCGIRPSLTFFDRGAWRHVCHICTCTQKMSYFHLFLEKHRLSLSAQGKSIKFWEKNNARKTMCQPGPFWKDHLFRKFEENIIFPCTSLRKIIFHFPSKLYFREKQISSSPII